MRGSALLSTAKNMANHITAMLNGTTRQKLAFALAEKAGEAASVGDLFHSRQACNGQLRWTGRKASDLHPHLGNVALCR